MPISSRYWVCRWLLLAMGVFLPAATINIPGDFAEIQAAIDHAASGDEIVVAAGTYPLTGSLDFKGKSVTLRSASGDPNDTIIDGQGSIPYVVLCIRGEDTNTTLSGFTITRGYGWGLGGGMYNLNSSPTVNNCIFTLNWGRRGAGMNNRQSNPTVINCSFSGNWAENGGGMYNWDSHPIITNCFFGSNTVNENGGGMYNLNSSPTIANCIFSGNWGLGGGGMYNENSSPAVTNCTFSGNSAFHGGGLYNDENSSPTVTNCILWGDLPDEIDNDSSTINVTYSSIQGGFPGTGNMNADPRFVDADGDDNTPGTPDDNLRLQSGSPCIDAGNNSSVTQTTDIAGLPRIIDGNCDAAAAVDMGAYEFSRRYQGDLNDDCSVNLTDFTMLSAHWHSSAIQADIAIGCGDGTVDIEDLLIMADHWLKTW